MCSSIPLQHICVVQGVSSADVAGDVGFGVVSTLPKGYTGQHTHFHSRRVRGFVFCGWGRVDGKGRFPLLTKVICLEQMWLRIPKRKEKKKDSVGAHLLMLLSLFGFILRLIGKAKELNASGFEFIIQNTSTR